MTEGTYWQINVFTGCILSFLTIIFATHFCLCQRKIINTALMALDGIPYIYKKDTVAKLQATSAQHRLTTATITIHKR